MANTPLIPKEQLSAYQRWEMSSFDAVVDSGAQAAAHASELLQTREQAYQAGHADGLRIGMQKAAEDSQRLQLLLASVKQQCLDINQQLTDDLLNLALEVARQMVRQALTLRPELIAPLVQDALSRIAQPLSQAIVTLHPEDAAVVREHLRDHLAADGWRIVENPQTARGGCVVQTAASHVDASMDTRWTRLAATLSQQSDWLD